MALNVTTAVFGEGCNTATATPSLAQWDVGQILKIEGVDLPSAYQVDFSTEYTRNAIQKIGNAAGVAIPNELLQRSAPITAYIVLHEGENDRETEYWITIHITPRTPPETITPDPEEQSVIDETIAALQDGVADAEAAATSAEGSASDAADHAEDAEAWAVGQRAGADVPDTDPTYHNNSKYYAGAAEAAAEEAGRHEASWESWAQRAETAAGNAEGSATAADQSKTAAEAAAQTATQKANAAASSATEAENSASEAAQTVAGGVGAINTARDGALTAIGQAGTTQVNAVNHAGVNQVAAVNQAGATQVTAVEDKGAEVLDSIPQDYSELVDDVADLSRHLSDVESDFDEITEDIAPINWYNPNGTGYYNLSGNFTEALYFHWQDIPAVEGDVYRFYNWNGSQYVSVNARYIVNYKNNAVASGSKENVATYTVPSGLDFIRVSINTSSNSKPCITKNTEDVPTSEETYYPPVTVVKTDKTLLDTDLPANAKVVGDAIDEIDERTDNVENEFNAIAVYSVSLNRYNPDGVGYYNTAGTYYDSSTHHWQDFTATVSDVYRIYNWDGSKYVQAKFNYAVPYKNGTVQSGGASNTFDYIVPADRTVIRFSINTSIYTKPLITVNTTDVPNAETEHYDDTYVVKTDKTLDSQVLPANAHSVGVAIKNSELYPVNAVKPDMSMFSEFAACGDSFTIGSIFDGSDTLIGDFKKSSWASALARASGTNVYIYASGGSNTKLYQTRASDLPALLADTPKQLYLLCLGINDATSVTIGTVADLHEDYTQNPDTFYGNYGKIISQIKIHAPNAKIIISKVFIPTYYNSEFYDYSSVAIEEIADYYNIPFIDPAEIPFMCTDLYNTEIRTHGSHPTAPIYSAIAKGVKVLIDDCIAKNLSYFDDFYIPTT